MSNGEYNWFVTIGPAKWLCLTLGSVTYPNGSLQGYVQLVVLGKVSTQLSAKWMGK